MSCGYRMKVQPLTTMLECITVEQDGFLIPDPQRALFPQCCSCQEMLSQHFCRVLLPASFALQAFAISETAVCVCCLILGSQACGCDVEVTVGEVMQDDPDATVKRVQTEALNGQVSPSRPNRTSTHTRA